MQENFATKFRMSKIFTLVVLFVTTATASADVWVKPHTRANGTHVEGYWRSDPDGDERNNWSTFPNVNPRTGEPGRKFFKPQIEFFI